MKKKTIEGTVIKFNHVDADGDVFLPGCFKHAPQAVVVTANYNPDRLIGRADTAISNKELSCKIKVVFPENLPAGDCEFRPGFQVIDSTLLADGTRIIERAQLWEIGVVEKPEMKFVETVNAAPPLIAKAVHTFITELPGAIRWFLVTVLNIFRPKRD